MTVIARRAEALGGPARASRCRPPRQQAGQHDPAGARTVDECAAHGDRPRVTEPYQPMTSPTGVGQPAYLGEVHEQEWQRQAAPDRGQQGAEEDPASFRTAGQSTTQHARHSVRSGVTPREPFWPRPAVFGASQVINRTMIHEARATIERCPPGLRCWPDDRHLATPARYRPHHRGDRHRQPSPPPRHATDRRTTRRLVGSPRTSGPAWCSAGWSGCCWRRAIRKGLTGAHPSGVDPLRAGRARWRSDVDPHVVLVLLAGALGVYDPEGEPLGLRTRLPWPGTRRCSWPTCWRRPVCRLTTTWPLRSPKLSAPSGRIDCAY